MTRRLPAWATASAAYRHLRNSALYAVLVIGALTILALVIPFWLIDTTGPGVLLMMLFLIFYVVGWLSIALSWHRNYLRPDAGLTGRQAFFGPVVYGLQLLSISSLSGSIIIPMIFLFFLADEFSGNVFSELAKRIADRDTMTGITAGIVILCVPYFFARLTFALPACALGRDDIGPWASWKHTRGNGLRLLSAWILAAVPPLVLAFLCLEIASPKNLQDWPALTNALRICGLAFVPIAVLNTLSVISIAYAFLVEKKAVPRPERPEAMGVVARSRHALNTPSTTKP
ncbi:MAG: hypothetical protein AAGC99_22620 [Pseudomonadota bacterium]